jgi:uncharacterized membrane protein YdfJ with MMPL/SSD domain
MKLLGAWNWYLPSWLQWLPRPAVEGGCAPAPSAQTTTRPVLAAAPVLLAA